MLIVQINNSKAHSPSHASSSFTLTAASSFIHTSNSMTYSMKRKTSATMPWQSETTLTKKGKEEIQAKAKVAIATDLETQTVTVLTHHAIPTPDRKEKVKVALKKANPCQQIVPQAIANQKNHAAIAVVQTTPHAPATRDRTTKIMRRTRPHHTNRLTSIYRSMKPLLLCFKTPS